MLKITHDLHICKSEIHINFVRSPGPGGQNVNKTATAAQLRFNITKAKSIPEELRLRLLSKLANKITQGGEIVIKAYRHRTQERNKQDAIDRLIALLTRGSTISKKRKKTKPTKSSIERRLANKKKHGKTKLLRKPTFD